MTQQSLFDNRRFDSRIPLEMHVSAYVQDQPQRAFTLDISESGLYLNALIQHPYPPMTPVGLEFELPSLGETIWAAGETCRDNLDNYFYGIGVRFTRMANLHQRMLREYCWHARARELRQALPDGARRGSSKEPSQGSFIVGGTTIGPATQRPRRRLRLWPTPKLP